MKRINTIFMNLFMKKQGSVGSATIILMITVLLSRVLGLVRGRILTGVYTTGELGIYFAAFRLPNMIFELLVLGTLTTAFIPIFTRLLSKRSEEDAWHMSSVVMNYSFVTLLFISVPILLFTEQLSRFLAPGFSPEEITTMANMTRLMMIFQVLPLILGNFLTGILQSYQLFLIPALAPVVYNVGTIVGIVIFAPTLGLYAPVVGVVIGALLFFFIQIPLLFALRFKYRWGLGTRVEGVREVAKLMAPRTIALGVSQIDTTVDLMLASFLGSSMITVFNFAQQLQQLPIGLFGATIAQAALPTLARSSANEDKGQFRTELISAIHQILFFVLPISVLFIILRISITRLVFGWDKFDWEATVLTGKTLSAFSLSLFAQSIYLILVRAFYALYDTKTPVVIGVVGILLNVVLSIFFVQYLGWPVWSLGFSTSIATILHVFILIFFLQRKIGRFTFQDLVITPCKMGIAASIMGGILFVLQRLLDQLVFDTTRTINLLLLVTSIGSIGMISYFFLCWVFGVGQVNHFLVLLNKVKHIRKFLPFPFFSSADTDRQM